MTRHEVVRRGARLGYGRQGEGPPLVLVQGLGLPGTLWLDLPERMAEAGFTVLTPDNRGTGDSDAPARPYMPWELGDDLAAVLAHARVGPALVLGISLGGMIVQHTVLRHSDAVAGLVLAATTCGPPMGRLPAPRALVTLVRSIFQTQDSSGINALLAHPDSLARDPDLLRPIDDYVDGEGRDARRAGILAQLAAAALHSTGHRLRGIRCPTEVIVGESDHIIPTVNSEILAARIPGATLTVIPRTGHVFPLEAPGALPAAIGRVAARLGWSVG